MKYIRVADAERLRINLGVSNIHKSGSVRGMVSRFNWDAKRAVRIGSYIYHLNLSDLARAEYAIRPR